MTRYRSLLWHGQQAPKPGTDQWRAVMTASKVSAAHVPSRSPYQSYFALWHEMAGNLPGAIEDDVLQRGRILEPAIAAWFQEQHPEWNVRSPRGRWWVHPDDTRFAATPDFIVEQGGEVVGLLECKSAQDTTEWGKPGTAEIPDHYADQVQWQMYCTGERRVYVAVITGLTFREYVVDYDPAAVDRLVATARKFMGALEAGQAPSVDPDAGHLATYQAVRDLHPDIDDTTVEVPYGLAVDYVQARVDLKAAEAAERAAKTRLADALGTGRVATCDGRPVAERRAKAGGTPYLQAARKLPTDLLTPPEPASFPTPDVQNDLNQKAA